VMAAVAAFLDLLDDDGGFFAVAHVLSVNRYS